MAHSLRATKQSFMFGPHSSKLLEFAKVQLKINWLSVHMDYGSHRKKLIVIAQVNWAAWEMLVSLRHF